MKNTNLMQYMDYAHDLVFVVFWFGLVRFTHILQGYFVGIREIIWFPQC